MVCRPGGLRVTAAAVLVMTSLAGCASQAPATAVWTPVEPRGQAAAHQDAPQVTDPREDDPRAGTAPGTLRPDGTLGNGLLPENWGETS